MTSTTFWKNCSHKRISHINTYSRLCSVSCCKLLANLSLSLAMSKIWLHKRLPKRGRYDYMRNSGPPPPHTHTRARAHTSHRRRTCACTCLHEAQLSQVSKGCESRIDQAYHIAKFGNPIMTEQDVMWLHILRREHVSLSLQYCLKTMPRPSSIRSCTDAFRPYKWIWGQAFPEDQFVDHNSRWHVCGEHITMMTETGYIQNSCMPLPYNVD